MDDAGPAGPPTDEAVEAVFRRAAAGEPQTSREVAAAVGCEQSTAYRRLQRLVADGVLETKKAGRARVWWLPLGDDREGRQATGDDGAYETLRANEGLFRAVFEGAFDAMLIADDDGRYVDANPAACELFGLAREALLGQRAADFAADGYDVERAWADFRESDLDRGLFPLQRPDGERRILEFAATPDILPGRHLSVLRDVTERREAQSKLARERERSRQYERTLAADTVIELEVEIDEGDVFGAVTEAFDVRCEFEGTVTTTDEQWLHYLTIERATADDVAAIAAAVPEMSACRVVFEADGETLVEVSLARSPVQRLVEAGANARELWSESGTTTIVAEVGADADVQGVVDEFRSAYPGAVVTTKRTLDRPIVTTRQYRESVAERLTERQTETLRAAHLAGYYEWPRDSQAEEVAAVMGVASSTWLRHLRLAEAKLVDWFFEELEA